MQKLFSGVCTALVTPFKNGEVDYDAMAKIIEHQIAGGVSAISVLGTTGEPSTITDAEKKKIIKFCIKTINKRVKVLVGTGHNCTKDAVEATKFAKQCGADGALVVTPYYNKCTQAGLVEYYKEIAKVGLPILVYNVPSRTGVNIQPKTMEEIAKIPQVFGLKQASSNMSETLEIFRNLSNKIGIYSGEDDLNYLFYCMGGAGCVSVTANAYPKEVACVYNEVQNNNYQQARKAQNKLAGINKAMFCEVNPIPVKACLSLMGFCTKEMRAPLTPISAESSKVLAEEMKKLKKSW